MKITRSVSCRTTEWRPASNRTGLDWWGTGTSAGFAKTGLSGWWRWSRALAMASLLPPRRTRKFRQTPDACYPWWPRSCVCRCWIDRAVGRVWHKDRVYRLHLAIGCKQSRENKMVNFYRSRCIQLCAVYGVPDFVDDYNESLPLATEPKR